MTVAGTFARTITDIHTQSSRGVLYQPAFTKSELNLLAAYVHVLADALTSVTVTGEPARLDQLEVSAPRLPIPGSGIELVTAQCSTYTT